MFWTEISMDFVVLSCSLFTLDPHRNVNFPCVFVTRAIKCMPGLQTFFLSVKSVACLHFQFFLLFKSSERESTPGILLDTLMKLWLFNRISLVQEIKVEQFQQLSSLLPSLNCEQKKIFAGNHTELLRRKERKKKNSRHNFLVSFSLSVSNSFVRERKKM